MNERDAEKIREGKEARWLLQVAQPVYDEQRQTLINRGIWLFDQGSLDERTAVSLWAALSQLEKFRNELESKITTGESASLRTRMVQ